MTKLEDLNLDDLLTNADNMLEDNPSLLDEIAILMNSEEKAKLVFLESKAKKFRTRNEQIEKKHKEMQRLMNVLQRLQKEEKELLKPIQILNMEVSTLFNQAIERMKLEKYKN